MADSFDIVKARTFTVTEVVATDPPEGISDGKWCRYTIMHDSAPITGIRAGSPASVRRYAEEFADNLNQRVLGFSPGAARAAQKK